MIVYTEGRTSEGEHAFLRAGFQKDTEATGYPCVQHIHVHVRNDTQHFIPKFQETFSNMVFRQCAVVEEVFVNAVCEHLSESAVLL